MRELFSCVIDRTHPSFQQKGYLCIQFSFFFLLEKSITCSSLKVFVYFVATIGILKRKLVTRAMHFECEWVGCLSSSWWSKPGSFGLVHQMSGSCSSWWWSIPTMSNHCLSAMGFVRVSPKLVQGKIKTFRAHLTSLRVTFLCARGTSCLKGHVWHELFSIEIFTFSSLNGFQHLPTQKQLKKSLLFNICLLHSYLFSIELVIESHFQPMSWSNGIH